jgi:beta-galactosidase
MAENGLSVARTWLYWITVNPKPDVWVWEEYDAFFEAARRSGMKVLVQLMLDSPPYWFQRRHPEALFVDENGDRVQLHAHMAQQVGGAPGPCFHVEAGKGGAEEYMRRAVERYRDHEALLAWDVWNEVWIRECYCPATQDTFRAWLLETHGGLAALNRAWYTSYGDVEEVQIPRDRGVYATLVDVAPFRRWVRADSMRWRCDFVRALDPKRPVVSHFTQPYSVNCDPWVLTEPLDAWGTSCYYADFHDISILFDATRDAAKGKPWWLSEEPGGHLSFYLDERSNRTPAQLRSTTLWAIGKGATGALFWQWRPELFGQESPHFGVTSVAGEPTPRTEAVAEIGAMLRRRHELFDELIPAQRQVGLVLDLDVLAYEPVAVPPRAGGAGATPPTMWTDHFKGLYRALVDQGYGVEILDAGQLASGEVPAGLKVLVLPLSVIERAGLLERLATWVEAGGALIAGPLCGLYGPDTFTNRSQPPAAVAGLFGVVQDGDLVHAESPRIELVPGATLGTSTGLIPATYVLQPLRPQAGTEVLGVSDGFVTLTAARRGQGLAVMLGGLVGNQYSRTERPGVALLLDAVCRSAGAVPPARTTNGVLTQVARAGAQPVLFVHNPHDTSVETWVRLAESKDGLVVDLLTETQVAEASSGQPFKLGLAQTHATALPGRGRRTEADRVRPDSCRLRAGRGPDGDARAGRKADRVRGAGRQAGRADPDAGSAAGG